LEKIIYSDKMLGFSAQTFINSVIVGYVETWSQNSVMMLLVKHQERKAEESSKRRENEICTL